MAEDEKKQKSRRSKVKHAALKKRYNSRIRQEYIDMDYLDQLSEEELQWMNDFMKEWNNAGVSGIKDKTNKTAEESNRFHKTAKEAKECTDRNNSRNRDMYSIAKAQNMIHKEDYEIIAGWLEEKEPVSNNYTEDAMVELLDESEKLGQSTDDTDTN